MTLTIEQGQTEVEFDIQTLVDCDASTNEVIDQDEPIEYFDVRVSLDGVTLDTKGVNIDDDFTVVDEWGEPQVLVRTSAAGPFGPFLGGINPLNSDALWSEDWHTGDELPQNGTILYLDDWTPLIGILSRNSWNPFYNPTYNAGIRQGSIMIHAGKNYYFADLEAAADGNNIGSEGDFDKFLESAKKHYEFDQLMLEFRNALFTQDNATHRELLKLLDEHYFKTGVSNIFSGGGEDAFDKAKLVVNSTNTLWDTVNDILDQDPFDDVSLVFEEAQLVSTETIGTITTTTTTEIVAAQFNYEQVVISRGDGFYAVYEKAEYEELVETTTEIQTDEVVWKRHDEIEVGGIEGPTLSQILEGIDTVNTAINTVGNSLTILNGALTEDPIEGLDVIEGILNIGSDFAPVPGVSQMFEMYADMVHLSQGLMNNVNDTFIRNNVQELIRQTRGSPGLSIENDETIGKIRLLRGNSSTFFSAEWLKSKSDFFDEILD